MKQYLKHANGFGFEGNCFLCGGSLAAELEVVISREDDANYSLVCVPCIDKREAEEKSIDEFARKEWVKDWDVQEMLKDKMAYLEKEINRLQFLMTNTDIISHLFISREIDDLKIEYGRVRVAYLASFPNPETTKHQSSRDEVAAIKETISPEAFLGQPKKKNAGKWWYKCQLHIEKTPSFCWNEHKKYWHCFGCQAGGSIIDLYMGINKCDFKTAVAELKRFL